MRLFEFRVWDKKNKEMLPVFRLHFMSGGAVSVKRHIYGEDIIDLKNCELMQFTGFYDKNGKEIYEGDIIVASWHWEESHIIKWPEDYYDWVEYGLDEKYIEVTGNIHQNPELVKDAK
jgi:uncharacterized phage protein (TIGR01671 family)